MKTKGMKHQLTALRKMAGRESFALFMDMGTGKTWTFLADAERLYNAGKIDAMLVVAPKGVHTNWVLRECPVHLDCPFIARAWISGAGKAAMQHIEEIFAPREEGSPYPLRILSMNIDALRTKSGFAFAKCFLIVTKAVFVIDESTRIKNEKTENYRACSALRGLAPYRRIGSGLPITRRPPDVFSQMEWLESGLLGTTSFRAFTAEYTQLMSPDHPMMKKMIQKNPRIAWAQIPEKDERTGRPVYRNLDKLRKLLEPHSFRVLKSQCLDLPPKVYKNVYFDLTPKQFKAYKLMEKQFRFELDDGELAIVSKLNSVLKLQQLTSGFLIDPERKPIYVETEGTPRLDALLEIDEDLDEPYIVWCHFQEEIKQVVAALKKRGRRVVEYHGRISSQKVRDVAVDDFQNGRADVFVGQPASGGIGLTLTAAKVAVYYSNSYNLEERNQSEDRCHRKGTVGDKVLYIDLVAQGTIDEIVAQSLQDKQEMATIILDGSACLDRIKRAA